MLPKNIQNARTLFHASRFDVREIELPGATPQAPGHRREIVVHPGAVVILPLIDARTVVMIRNQRWAVGQELWELPAGTLEPPEPPRDCAARELIEETGYRAGSVEPLLEFYTSPGICTELMHAFIARDLQHVGQELEETEQITVEVLPLDRAIEMVRSHEVRDGKTLATLLFYHTLVRGSR